MSFVLEFAGPNYSLYGFQITTLSGSVSLDVPQNALRK
jgi:hypothetical protein